MFGVEKREDDEGEEKRKRSAREAEAGSAAQRGEGGHFRGQNHARGQELRA